MKNRKMMVIFKSILVISIICLSTASYASDFYLRKGASGNGSDWSNAWGDINNISGITSGDVVYIAAGNYTGNYTANSSGWTLKRATISAHGYATGWSPVYDGTVNINGAGDVTVFQLSGYNTITIDGVDKAKFIIYGDSSRRPKLGIEANSSPSYSIALRNITIHDMRQAGVKFVNANGGMELSNSEVYKNGLDGQEDTDANVHFDWLGNTHGNNIIANNYVHDASYADNPEKIDCITTIGSTNLYIYGNTIYGGWESTNSSDLISMRGGSNRYIYNNTFLLDSGNANQNIFISASNGDVTNTYIYNNVFYKPMSTTGSAGISIGWFGTSSYPNHLQGLYVYNNVFYGQEFGLYFASGMNASYMSNIIIKNNIFKSWAQASAATEIYSESSVGSAMTVDYNYYYQTVGEYVAYMGTAKTLAQVRSDWGWETHGSEGDPMFDSIGANGFHLTASSPYPLIGGGVDLSTIMNIDKNNLLRVKGLWDIGSYNYSSGDSNKASAPASPGNLRISN